MGFNDAVQSTGRAQTSTIFQSNVKIKYISGSKPINFKILPAHALACGGQPDSWIPFRTPKGDLTEWGRIIHLARFIGHGKELGTRRDFISPITFADESGEPVFCPLTRLFQMASQYVEWNYLVKERVNPSNPKEVLDKPAINRPTRHMICNIIDADDSSTGVVIGVFTKSSVDAICGSSKGVACRHTMATPEQIQQNYLSEWVVGDLTHPEYGPVLCAEKGTDKGDYSSYNVELAMDAATRRVRFKPIGRAELAARYNLQDPDSILVRQTPEMIIQGLCEVLNMVSPNGIHEHEFIRLVFPEYERLIPEHNYSSRNTPLSSATPISAPMPESSSIPAPAMYPASAGAASIPPPAMYPPSAGASTLPPPAINIPSSMPVNNQEQKTASIPGMNAGGGTELPSYSRDELLSRFKKQGA